MPAVPLDLRGVRVGLIVLVVVTVLNAPSTAAADTADATRAMEAVVGIATPTSVGTGFVTDSGVLTAAHVLGDADEVTVTHDGAVHTARVVRRHATLDIALLNVDLSVQPLALDVEPRIGEAVTVVTIDPVDGPVLTRGIISALPTVHGQQLVQTDAAVNPGTSGGPVLGDDGRVLGLVITKDPLRDDVGRAHHAQDLADFLAGREGIAPPDGGNSEPVAGIPAPNALPRGAPIGVAAAFAALLLLGLARGRTPRRPDDDIQISLGPSRAATDDNERSTS